METINLEVPTVASDQAHKRRRINIEPDITFLSCNEESFHLLAGIIAFSVMNRVIASCANESKAKDKSEMNRGILPDLITLAKIQKLWRKNLNKVIHTATILFVLY